MDKKIVTRNVIASILLQLVTIAYGFVVPKLILSYFGSEMNGLASSLTQFLNYIQLMEGGLSGVITAALYKPLAQKDTKKVNSILAATKNFFRHIALIYIVYVLAVGLLYPLLNNVQLTFFYVFALTIVLAVGLFVQYFFSLTYRLLITADQKGYIVSYSSILMYAFNLIAALLVVKIYPNFLLLKAASAIGFTIQPIIYAFYVKKHYQLDFKNVTPDKEALSQRWDGFGQNLAYFIHTNTDIVLLTFFAALTDVSVYSVYFMIIGALKELVRSISTAISPSFGNTLASKNQNECNTIFSHFELLNGFLSTLAFTCCAILIVPFISVYTSGITDANYIQPIFSVILCAGEYVYCIREPFVDAAYNSGHFKQTAIFAYIEAGLNIVISLLLINKLGLIGVAIGTLISMSVRAILHVYYVKKNILNRPIRLSIKSFVSYLIPAVICFILFNSINIITVTNYLNWILYALIVGLVTLLCLTCSIAMFHKRTIVPTFKDLFRSLRRKIHGKSN